MCELRIVPPQDRRTARLQDRRTDEVGVGSCERWCVIAGLWMRFLDRISLPQKIVEFAGH